MDQKEHIEQLQEYIRQLEHDIEIHKEIRKELDAKIKKLNQPRMTRQMVVRSVQSVTEDGIQGERLAAYLNAGWKVVCSNYVPIYEGLKVIVPAYIEYILEKEIEDEQQTESEAL